MSTEECSETTGTVVPVAAVPQKNVLHDDISLSRCNFISVAFFEPETGEVCAKLKEVRKHTAKLSTLRVNKNKFKTLLACSTSDTV